MPAPIAFDASSQVNQTSLDALESAKTDRGFVVTDALRNPADPNQLLITLGDASRGLSPLRTRALTDGPALKILCVHGVNHLEPNAPNDPPTPAEQGWRDAIAQGMAHWGARAELHFLAYNEHFEGADLSPLVLAKAVARLSASAIWHGIGDLFGGGARGFGPQGGLGETLEWTAGMVSEWAGNDQLRAALRKTLLAAIQEHQPKLILAHSLGTLIAYDTLARPAHAKLSGVAGVTLATFGSQVGHPVVRKVLGGRIVSIPALRHWFHLYNRKDNVFTAPLDVRFKQGEAPNFSQHTTAFDIPSDPLNHDASHYLLHGEALRFLWRDAATQAGAVPADLPGMPRLMSLAAAPARPSRGSTKIASPYLGRSAKSQRALLVGLSQYPNPANNLAGCTNDVFLMSRMLQETGFPAENIRIVLNDRATSSAILERLEWLLDGAADGQDRVFYYAGHGAQIPGYGAGETIDQLDECLVPYDFAWSRETAVLDDQFYELYSQLPENTHFLTIFDCCHSGGMTREGGLLARGLTPPDDIRHRLLKWDADIGVFDERKLAGEVVISRKPSAAKPDYRHGPLRKLGCAAALRPKSADKKKYDLARNDFGHHGPFMPILLQACNEGELAYEYRHGAESNGAFTWFLVKTLQEKKRRGQWTWESLAKEVADRLTAQGYTQTPQLICPTSLRPEKIPWQPGRKKERSPA